MIIFLLTTLHNPCNWFSITRRLTLRGKEQPYVECKRIICLCHMFLSMSHLNTPTMLGDLLYLSDNRYYITKKTATLTTKSLHLFRCVLKSRQVWNVADLAGKIAQCSCRRRKRKPCCNIGRQLVRLSKLTRSCEVYSCTRFRDTCGYTRHISREALVSAQPH